MNESDLTDAALDALLSASTPLPLAADDFVARTMSAVDQAARTLSAPRRSAPVAPLAIARALAAEQRRHEAQARLWRWAIAGVVAGVVLLVFAVMFSPGGVTLQAPTPSQWYPLTTLLAIGALWVAWRELRSG